MEKGKIERAAVRAVEDYIDNYPLLEPNIYTNDRTPIWDGELYVYKSQKHSVNNFSARIPLQVKGTLKPVGNFYRLSREHVISYKKERGTLFFLVQLDVKLKPIKIFYNMLSLEVLSTLLEQKRKTIKIDLYELPFYPDDFEGGIFEFARKRNGEELDILAMKEMETLTKKFEESEKYLNEIEDNHVRLKLESLFNNIKKLKGDGTIGGRDKFIIYSQNAIDLIDNNIVIIESNNLQLEFGKFLHQQKQYHLAKDYYVKALYTYRELAKNNPKYMEKVAMTANNLARLHNDLNCPVVVKYKYKGMSWVGQKLAKDRLFAYKSDITMPLKNNSNRYNKYIRTKKTVKEKKEIQKIYRKLAKNNPNINLFK